MSRRIHRGLWLFRVFMMCASLVCIILMIEHLKTHKISFEPMTGAQAEEGITARVQRSPGPSRTQAHPKPEKSQAPESEKFEGN